MLKRLFQSLFGHRNKYYRTSSSDVFRRPYSRSSSDEYRHRKHHSPHSYGHGHYKKKHRSHSFFSS